MDFTWAIKRVLKRVRPKMLVLAELLNEQRRTLYKGFSVFVITTEASTTDEEYKAIMKAFNRLLK